MLQPVVLDGYMARDDDSLYNDHGSGFEKKGMCVRITLYIVECTMTRSIVPIVIDIIIICVCNALFAFVYDMIICL